MFTSKGLPTTTKTVVTTSLFKTFMAANSRKKCVEKGKYHSLFHVHLTNRR